MEAKEYTGVRHHYVWGTEYPRLGRALTSQSFSLKCVKWHFKFSVSENNTGVFESNLYMVFDSEPRVVWNVTTYVKDKEGALDRLCTTDYKYIYDDVPHEKKCPNILTKLDAIKLQMNKHKYLYNGKITFVITIDESIRSLFDVKRNVLGAAYEEGHNLEDLSISMTKMFENKYFSDVEINCESRIFFAHRNVLAARSAYFAKMFERDLHFRMYTKKLQIEDVESDIFEKFLRFLYSGKVEFESITTEIKLYELAKKYDIFLLKQRCFYFLIGNITRHSFEQIIEFAEKEEEKDIMIYILDFMLTDETFLRSEEGLNFIEKCPHIIHVINKIRKANKNPRL